MNKTGFRPRGTTLGFDQENSLTLWAEAFLNERRAQNLSPGSITFYTKKLKVFLDYCSAQAVTAVDQLTPNYFRQFFLHLEDTGHTPGGVHTYFRTLKAFLRWYEQEVEPEDWKNPFRKVKPPKVPDDKLDPVALDAVEAMIATCDTSFTGRRDKAILLCLLDTGARANELLSLDINHIDLISGQVNILFGKGRKHRTVYISADTRKAVRKYLQLRKDPEKALWLTTLKDGRLEYDGLRDMLNRRSALAHLEKKATAHAFRRAFALSMLRAGTDLETLAEMMGHASLAVLQRYLKLDDLDIQRASRAASPVDRMRNRH